ncbi:MAG: hypothetical protein JXQ96_13490 [Cyclobacteriaceae bacterium]
MNKLFYAGILASTLFACSQTKNKVQTTDNQESISADRPLAKFEPEDGKVILFAGQELEAVGGLDDYSDGYIDHFDTPGGFTTYSGLSVGGDSFGYTQQGLDGIFSTADWGDGDYNMSLAIADEDFKHSAVAIGFWMVNHEQEVAEGKTDSLIVVLGKYLKSLGDRPVFLRIGYEFDGHSWNHYDINYYKQAYRRIKDKLDQIGVENVAYVWQSTGWVSNLYQLEEWYPGDEYVDWCAYSFFSRFDEAKMIDFARQKGKPVFIAEATPTISDHTVKFDGRTKKTYLSDPADAEEAWEKWFIPFFKTINDNPDVVKAISYINCNWKDHAMWKQNPTFQGVDARLQLSPMISQKWKEETSRDKYLKASPELFDYLWGKK